MKVLVVLAACAVFAGAFGATRIRDGHEDPVFEILGDDIKQDGDNAETVDATDDLSPIKESSDDPTELVQPSYRDRRFSCDVLSLQSKWVSPNHSACAVRCLAQRRKGGKCKNGDCVCR
uniref:Defensin 2-2a3 n=1 Tax=Nasonia vitripennis TaxID=7425 RepID=I1ZEL3_NASVI|nr:defensin 2-2a3 precursor [Nasonia vitripennis]